MDPATRELENLYGQMGPALLAYFRQHRILAGTAEDLLQDTFVRAWRNFGRLQASITPRAYLFGIARNVGRDALRKYRPMQELVDEPAAAPAIEDGRLEPMRAAIARLPPSHREPLLLKLQQELTYVEIAEVLEIPVGTVRSRLHHAVAQLKLALNSTPHPETRDP